MDHHQNDSIYCTHNYNHVLQSIKLILVMLYIRLQPHLSLLQQYTAKIHFIVQPPLPTSPPKSLHSPYLSTTHKMTARSALYIALLWYCPAVFMFSSRFHPKIGSHLRFSALHPHPTFSPLNRKAKRMMQLCTLWRGIEPRPPARCFMTSRNTDHLVSVSIWWTDIVGMR